MQSRFDWLVRRCDCNDCVINKKRGCSTAWVAEVWDLHRGTMVSQECASSMKEGIERAGRQCLTLEMDFGLTTGSFT